MITTLTVLRTVSALEAMGADTTVPVIAMRMRLPERDVRAVLIVADRDEDLVRRDRRTRVRGIEHYHLTEDGRALVQRGAAVAR